MGFNTRLFFPLTLVVLFHANTAVSTSCYYPDGSIADGLIPCYNNGNDTMCCATNDACTTNGWCLGSSGYPYRGACTDSSWASGSCLSYCPNPPNESSDLYACASGQPTNQFCCYSGSGATDTSCCNDANGSYTFGNYFTGYAFLPGGYFEDDSTGNESTVITETVTVTVSVPSSTGGASSSNGTDPSDCKSSSGLSTASTVGLAVGIPLGVLALGILGYLFWRASRKSRLPAANGRVNAWQSGEIMSPSAYEKQERHELSAVDRSTELSG